MSKISKLLVKLFIAFAQFKKFVCATLNVYNKQFIRKNH